MPSENPLTKTINSFFGVRNLSNDRSIPDNALTRAVDVDIDDAGIILRRQGYQYTLPISNVTSAYTTLAGDSYVVSSGVLSRIDDGLVPHALAPSTATSFCDSGKVLFTNDGLKVQNDRVTDLNLPPADNVPLTLTTAPGDWPAGTYSAVYTYSGASGLEGPAGAVASVTIAEGRVVLAAHPPQLSGYTTTVYITEADGTVFYAADDRSIDPDIMSSDVFPVGGTTIAWFNSSLYVGMPQANGSTIIGYSLPFKPHLFDWAAKYIIIPGDVRAMYGRTEGLVICTDAAILLYDGAALITLASYGVPAGQTIAPSADGATILIWSNHGVLTFPPFTNQTEDKCSLPAGKHAAVATVVRDGIEQLIILTDGQSAAYNART